MKISFNRFFTFLALSFFIFSCTEEAVEAPKEAITLGTIEQFLGTEINTPEDFP